MNMLLVLLPVALFLGAVGLVAFFWSMRTGQFDDPDGDAIRILFDEDDAQSSVSPVRGAPHGRRGLPPGRHAG